MKKYIFILGLLFSTLSIFAMPAKRGVTKTITLADGTSVVATLNGDEYCHYWKTDDGRVFRLDENDNPIELTTADFEIFKANGRKRMTAINAVRQQRMASARQNPSRVGSFTTYEGKKKGLVILVNFSNLTFKDSLAQAEIDSMFNQVGYCENYHIGSVHDYFYDQSYGKFDLEFDVVGPVTVPKTYSYYGKNGSYGSDQHPCEMVISACNLVDSIVNFADYDWDGDGYVDQVFLVYAGHGENASSVSSQIWPHEWQLSSGEYYDDGEGAQELDGVIIDTYAVSCELAGKSSNTLCGIGAPCHEFSHCLGYPDFYDTDYSGAWGMNSWDILDYGSYNGPMTNGEVPAGYTSYERWVAGWIEPTELNGGEVVDSMKPLTDEPEAYIIYNDSVPTEYFLLENRQPKSWFSYLGSDKMTKGGMLVLHVDYDETAWYNNTPNDKKDHQRMTIIPANNKMPSYPTMSEFVGQMFPYNSLDSLSNWSSPSTETYNMNSNRKKFMDVALENIKRNDDGTMSFSAKEAYFLPQAKPIDPTGENVIFYESFNQCNGKGGNDGKWSGSNIAYLATAYLPDNEGWVSSKCSGGYQCAKFGSSSVPGVVSTPEIPYAGDVEVTFNAGAWNLSSEPVRFTVSVDSVVIDTLEMELGDWTTYAFKATLNGNSRITFSPQKRIFLDEVTVAKIIDPSGIKAIEYDENRDNRVYSITGQYLGNNINTLPSGLYIKRGKKVLKR